MDVNITKSVKLVAESGSKSWLHVANNGHCSSERATSNEDSHATFGGGLGRLFTLLPQHPRRANMSMIMMMTVSSAWQAKNNYRLLAEIWLAAASTWHD